jgi:hypothetical protein
MKSKDGFVQTYNAQAAVDAEALRRRRRPKPSLRRRRRRPRSEGPRDAAKVDGKPPRPPPRRMKQRRRMIEAELTKPR